MYIRDDDFPFHRSLSFDPLIAFWRERAASGAGAQAAMAAELVAAVERVPALTGTIEDSGIIERNRELVSALLSAVFPDALADETLGAAFAPFTPEPFFTTDALRRHGLSGQFESRLTTAESLAMRTTIGFQLVLQHCYGKPIDFGMTLLSRGVDPDTGLDRFFRLMIDPRFAEVRPRGEQPVLSPAQVERLLEDRTDLALWAELLPPDRFEFRGIVLIRAVDVTPQESMAVLTRELLRRDAMATPADIENLQRWVRVLLRQPRLELGLICLHQGELEAIEHAHPMGRSLLLSEGVAPDCAAKAESFYARVFEMRETLTVRDLRDGRSQTGFEQHLLSLGLRNLLIAPLQVDGRLVGILELGSPTADDMHVLNTGKLQEVLTLFSTAMQRSLDEEETRVQAVIKQQYTAIHPSVEWRFRRAALRFIQERDAGSQASPEPIVLENVYALYGLSDIRGSSAQRAAAIQDDLVEQLKHARSVVAEARRARPLPVLDEMDYRLHGFSDHLSAGLTSGDEVRVHEFLRAEIEPLFDQLATFGSGVRRVVDEYHAALDPGLGIVYRRRKQFEDSVTMINAAIAERLEEQQVVAQRMFPHYFEKFKTDGVDYNIYVGAALQEDGDFQPLFLRNLRIWQLMVTCEIAWKLDEVRPRLPVPLEAAHLILAQETPISIRFRTDEKRFDVDGAYNIRYEIVKKRIDKARVRGTREQVTQPGRIAIVYAQPRQAAEYLQYVAYLQSAGYLGDRVEELELEDLQGVRGLAALRVTVAPRPAAASDLADHTAELIASMAED